MIVRKAQSLSEFFIGFPKDSPSLVAISLVNLSPCDLEEPRVLACEILLQLGPNPQKNVELILDHTRTYLGCDDVVYEAKSTGGEETGELEVLVQVDNIVKSLRISPPRNPKAQEALPLIAALLRVQEVQFRDRNRISSMRAYSNSIFDGSPDGLLIMDHQGFITGVNRTLIRMTGVARTDLLGRRAHALIPRKSYRRALMALQETFQTGKARFKLELNLPSGRSVPVSVSATTLSLNTDSLVFCSIRSLQKYDDRVEQSERFANSFLSVIQGASDAFLMAEETGIISHVNPALEGLLGCPASRLIGKSVDHILDSSCMKRYRFSFLQVHRENYSACNGLLNTADGSSIPVRILFWKHRIDDQEAIRVVIQDMRSFLSDSLFDEWKLEAARS